ncbi:hypothetical protein ACU684_09660 [Pseudomonas sp. LF135]
MSDVFSEVVKNNSSTVSLAKRAVAVAAALELIKTYAGSTHPKFSLTEQMKLLSSHADQIQDALKVK